MEDKKIRLRALEPEDLDFLYEIENDESLWEVGGAVLWQIDAPAARAILFQLDHEAWAGFRAWDLVMPLFLFISGTSIPFSFGKMLASGGKAAVYRKTRL